MASAPPTRITGSTRSGTPFRETDPRDQTRRKVSREENQTQKPKKQYIQHQRNEGDPFVFIVPVPSTEIEIEMDKGEIDDFSDLLHVNRDLGRIVLGRLSAEEIWKGMAGDPIQLYMTLTEKGHEDYLVSTETIKELILRLKILRYFVVTEYGEDLDESGEFSASMDTNHLFIVGGRKELMDGFRDKILEYEEKFKSIKKRLARWTDAGETGTISTYKTMTPGPHLQADDDTPQEIDIIELKEEGDDESSHGSAR